jgi:hypothetical protein
LHNAFAVTQIHKNDTPVVPPAMIPAVKSDFFVEVAFVDVTAIVATHNVFFLWLTKNKGGNGTDWRKGMQPKIQKF